MFSNISWFGSIVLVTKKQQKNTKIWNSIPSGFWRANINKQQHHSTLQNTESTMNQLRDRPSHTRAYASAQSTPRWGFPNISAASGFCCWFSLQKSPPKASNMYIKVCESKYVKVSRTPTHQGDFYFSIRPLNLLLQQEAFNVYVILRPRVWVPLELRRSIAVEGDWRLNGHNRRVHPGVHNEAAKQRSNNGGTSELSRTSIPFSKREWFGLTKTV